MIDKKQDVDNCFCRSYYKLNYWTPAFQVYVILTTAHTVYKYLSKLEIWQINWGLLNSFSFKPNILLNNIYLILSIHIVTIKMPNWFNYIMWLCIFISVILLYLSMEISKYVYPQQYLKRVVWYKRPLSLLP